METDPVSEKSCFLVSGILGKYKNPENLNFGVIDYVTSYKL
jgi:hypothetical protein